VDFFHQHLEVAERADAIGLDLIAVPDSIGRHFPRLETSVYLGALIARTKRIKFSTDVFQVPLRHPIDIARRVLTLDIMSQGRFIFGVGLGGVQKEFETLQIDWKSRGRRFDEAIEVIKRLWIEDSVTHNGEFYQFKDMVMDPKPYTKPRPQIWYGGWGDKALQRVAKIADGWSADYETLVAPTWSYKGALEDYKPWSPEERLQTLRNYYRELGRDPKLLQFSFILHVNINPDRNKAIEEMEYYWGHVRGEIEGVRNTDHKLAANFYGPPEPLLEKMKELWKLGPDRIVFYIHSADPATQLKRIEKEILPKI
jgi:alkanesulfonate monooxygenase SsuD/methylene tetrahydromethanopterin reductase-like flavin-dependent oxidoreductase (luciferase family)